ncbi:MAG: PorT family protein [Prevotella sp.]|nr:PorT family protein [Prevotella sp.]
MKRFFYIITLLTTLTTNALAQERRVQNRPYTDLRKFHFGVLVGTHLQDIEFENIGSQVVTFENGSTSETLITCDQDRWDGGFNVGVLGELRLNSNFAFRVAPAMYFGARHLTFRNLRNIEAGIEPKEQRQDLKTAYISAACDIIFTAQRFNNHRPYIMAGINPMINLSGKDDDFIKLKRYDIFLEIGAGCDFYLPYFKLRPELKFLYGLTNTLDQTHASSLRDKNKLPYTQSVSQAHSKMVVLTFHFE